MSQDAICTCNNKKLNKKLNFISQNATAIQNWRAVPRKKQIVFTHRGEVLDLSYLDFHKRKYKRVIIDKNKVTTEEKVKKGPLCRYIPQEERDKLLSDLKTKWEEKMSEFQTLPFINDTLTMINRKSKLEKYLQTLEKDIDTIERHPYIYIYDE